MEGTRLIKTYGLRGTVHLLATDDLRMWMAALSPLFRHTLHFRTAYASRRSKPNRGRRVRYTKPHRWTPGFRLVSPDKAVAMIIMHYLYGYGPATPQQFA
jgi:hypothetical protein